MAASIPMRRLRAARVVGATVLSVLGMRFVADAYTSTFLGAPAEWLSLVNVYGVIALLAAAAIAVGIVKGSGRASFAGQLLLAVNIGMAVPLLIHDVQIGGVIALWNILVIGDSVFGFAPSNPRARRDEPRDATFVWLQRHGPAAQHALLVSLLVGVAAIGYPIVSDPVPRFAALACGVGALALAGRFALGLLRSRRRYTVAVALLALMWLPSALANLLSALALLWVLQAAVLLAVAARGPTFGDLLRSFYSRPALLILATFGLLALGGALVLTFPAASADGTPIAFLDALFTAMSATCVTGLIVLDTPVDFSTFGHVAILALIQLGGLGIMVLSTFAAILLGGRLALRGEQALEEVLDLSSPGSAYELTRFIVVSTIVIEALGAGALALALHYNYGIAPLEALWRGTFHAISAFCNAGFSLWSDSLIQFQRDGLVQGVHAALIVLGGLGFPVLAALWFRARRGERRLPLQARVVLWTSLGLLVGGTLLYALAEWDASLAGLSIIDKWINAAFQSVTLRTAGFNTVDFTTLERSTILMMIVWMFIGASPGSTGGGIKTTTLAVPAAAGDPDGADDPARARVPGRDDHDAGDAGRGGRHVRAAGQSRHGVREGGVRGRQRAGDGRAVDRRDRRARGARQVADHPDDVHRPRRAGLAGAGARHPAQRAGVVPRGEGDGRVTGVRAVCRG
jgi:trk system potassium uptake protein TrkH